MPPDATIPAPSQRAASAILIAKAGLLLFAGMVNDEQAFPVEFGSGSWEGTR